MKHRALALAASAVLAVALLPFGCGSSDTTTPEPEPDPCYDYKSFDGAAPAVTFRDDVLPIFRLSCGLSDDCHGKANPTIPNQPFLGPPNADPPPTDAEIASILAGIVGVLAKVPGSNGAPILEPQGLDIVKKSDPAKSFMMAKLDALPTAPSEFCAATYTCSETSACGDSMPQFGPKLDADKIDVIRRWISQGAQDN